MCKCNICHCESRYLPKFAEIYYGKPFFRKPGGLTTHRKGRTEFHSIILAVSLNEINNRDNKYTYKLTCDIILTYRILMHDSIFSPDIRSNTPLHSSVSMGATLVSRALIEYGADVHAANKKGYTSLDYMIKNRRLDILKNLETIFNENQIARLRIWYKSNYSIKERMRTIYNKSEILSGLIDV